MRPKKGLVSLKIGNNKRGPRPKYHTPDAAKARGVVAGTARPSFDTDSSDHGGHSDSESERKKGEMDQTVDLPSEPEIVSSDLDTDFSADEQIAEPQEEVDTTPVKPVQQKSPKVASKPTFSYLRPHLVW